MKYFICILLFLPIITWGCSSIYSINNFSSKDKFYNNFNQAVYGKKIRVTLRNDSAFWAFEGSKIVTDSLDVVQSIQGQLKIIPERVIKKIKFYGNSYSKPSGYVYLYNGDVIEGKGIKVLADSSIQFIMLSKKNLLIPLTKIKQVSYKNRWLGIVPGTLIGTFLGSIFGVVVGIGVNSNNDQSGSESFFTVLGASVGAIAGAVIGWISGWQYIYNFNP